MQESASERPVKKRGRPKKVERTKGRHGMGDTLNLRLEKKWAPNMMKLIEAASPEQLEDVYGIVLPRDLSWPPFDSKSYSYRVAVILETIARRGRKGGTGV